MKTKWQHYVFAILIACGILGSTIPSFAAVSPYLSYQGKITDQSGAPLVASQFVQFTIYDADSGGNQIWQESQFVSFVNGHFNVQLGSSTALSAAVFDHTDRYLGIKVGSDPEMTPRVRLLSAPYALKASDADSVNGFTLDQNVTTTGFPIFGGLSLSNGAAVDIDLTDTNSGNTFKIQNLFGSLFRIIGPTSPNSLAEFSPSTEKISFDTKPGVGVNTLTMLGDDVGIGTDTPSSTLDVVGTVNATAFVGDGAQLSNIDAASLNGYTIDQDLLTNSSPTFGSVNATFQGFRLPLTSDPNQSYQVRQVADNFLMEYPTGPTTYTPFFKYDKAANQIDIGEAANPFSIDSTGLATAEHFSAPKMTLTSAVNGNITSVLKFDYDSGSGVNGFNLTGLLGTTLSIAHSTNGLMMGFYPLANKIRLKPAAAATAARVDMSDIGLKVSSSAASPDPDYLFHLDKSGDEFLIHPDNNRIILANNNVADSLELMVGGPSASLGASGTVSIGLNKDAVGGTPADSIQFRADNYLFKSLVDGGAASFDVTGTVNATTFVGDGAQLANIDAETVDGFDLDQALLTSSSPTFNELSIVGSVDPVVLNFGHTSGTKTFNLAAMLGSGLDSVGLYYDRVGSPMFWWDPNAGRVEFRTTPSSPAALSMNQNLVGIGTINPAYELDVVGTVNATAFIGDGSQVTGVLNAAHALTADDADRVDGFDFDQPLLTTSIPTFGGLVLPSSGGLTLLGQTFGTVYTVEESNDNFSILGVDQSLNTHHILKYDPQYQHYGFGVATPNYAFDYAKLISGAGFAIDIQESGLLGAQRISISNKDVADTLELIVGAPAATYSPDSRVSIAMTQTGIPGIASANTIQHRADIHRFEPFALSGDTKVEIEGDLEISKYSFSSEYPTLRFHKNGSVFSGVQGIGNQVSIFGGQDLSNPQTINEYARFALNESKIIYGNTPTEILFGIDGRVVIDEATPPASNGESVFVGGDIVANGFIGDGSQLSNVVASSLNGFVIDQNLRTTDSPTFNQLTVNGDISTKGGDLSVENAVPTLRLDDSTVGENTFLIRTDDDDVSFLRENDSGQLTNLMKFKRVNGLVSLYSMSSSPVLELDVNKVRINSSNNGTGRDLYVPGGIETEELFFRKPAYARTFRFFTDNDDFILRSEAANVDLMTVSLGNIIEFRTSSGLIPLLNLRDNKVGIGVGNQPQAKLHVGGDILTDELHVEDYLTVGSVPTPNYPFHINQNGAELFVNTEAISQPLLPDLSRTVIANNKQTDASMELIFGQPGTSFGDTGKVGIRLHRSGLSLAPNGEIDLKADYINLMGSNPALLNGVGVGGFLRVGELANALTLSWPNSLREEAQFSVSKPGTNYYVAAGYRDQVATTDYVTLKAEDPLNGDSVNFYVASDTEIGGQLSVLSSTDGELLVTHDQLSEALHPGHSSNINFPWPKNRTLLTSNDWNSVLELRLETPTPNISGTGLQMYNYFGGFMTARADLFHFQGTDQGQGNPVNVSVDGGLYLGYQPVDRLRTGAPGRLDTQLAITDGTTGVDFVSGVRGVTANADYVTLDPYNSATDSDSGLYIANRLEVEGPLGLGGTTAQYPLHYVGPDGGELIVTSDNQTGPYYPGHNPWPYKRTIIAAGESGNIHGVLELTSEKPSGPPTLGVETPGIRIFNYFGGKIVTNSESFYFLDTAYTSDTVDVSIDGELFVGHVWAGGAGYPGRSDTRLSVSDDTSGVDFIPGKRGSTTNANYTTLDPFNSGDDADSAIYIANQLEVEGEATFLAGFNASSLGAATLTVTQSATIEDLTISDDLVLNGGIGIGAPAPSPNATYQLDVGANGTGLKIHAFSEIFPGSGTQQYGAVRLEPYGAATGNIIFVDGDLSVTGDGTFNDLMVNGQLTLSDYLEVKSFPAAGAVPGYINDYTALGLSGPWAGLRVDTLFPAVDGGAVRLQTYATTGGVPLDLIIPGPLQVGDVAKLDSVTVTNQSSLNGLNVSGNASFLGEVKASTYDYTAPKTFYRNYGPQSFGFHDMAELSPSEAYDFYADLDLPDGARITGVTVYVRDDTSANWNYIVKVIRSGMNGGVYDDAQEIVNVTLPGPVSHNSQTIHEHTTAVGNVAVDNSAGYHILKFTFSGGTSNPDLYSVRVTYTLDEVSH